MYIYNHYFCALMEPKLKSQHCLVGEFSLICIYHKSCFVVGLSKSNLYHNCLKSVLVFSNIIVWWSQAAVICLSSLSCPAQHIQSHTLSYRTRHLWIHLCKLYPTSGIFVFIKMLNIIFLSNLQISIC